MSIVCPLAFESVKMKSLLNVNKLLVGISMFMICMVCPTSNVSVPEVPVKSCPSLATSEPAVGAGELTIVVV